MEKHAWRHITYGSNSGVACVGWRRGILDNIQQQPVPHQGQQTLHTQLLLRQLVLQAGYKSTTAAAWAGYTGRVPHMIRGKGSGMWLLFQVPWGQNRGNNTTATAQQPY